MKKLKIISLFLFVLSFGCNSIYAQSQQETAYEKKKEELMLQMWQKCGQRTAALINNTLSDKSDEEVYE